MEGLARTIKTILRRPRDVKPVENPSCASPEPSNNPPDIGLLCRPWRRIRKEKEPGTIFILSRTNYKVHANLGITTKAMRRFAVVVDTGAGSSFIRKSALAPGMEKLIKPIMAGVPIKDANNNRLKIAGRIDLVCQIGDRADTVSFYVAEKLATDVILGCNYCDHHVEAIRPRKRLIEMVDGSTVPIIRKPSKRAKDAVPLPEEQEYIPLKERKDRKIVVDKDTWI